MHTFGKVKLYLKEKSLKQKVIFLSRSHSRRIVKADTPPTEPALRLNFLSTQSMVKVMRNNWKSSYKRNQELPDVDHHLANVLGLIKTFFFCRFFETEKLLECMVDQERI